MGIDPPSYWANFFVYIFESKYVHQLIAKGFPHAYKFRGTSRFIDDLSTITDGGEFSTSCKYVYTKQVELTGVLKICSRFTGEHMPKCDVNKVALLCNFIEIILRHGCSPVNLLHIFRTTFTKNTSGWVLMFFSKMSNNQVSLTILAKKTPLH